MPCETIDFGDGGYAIVCSRGVRGKKCSSCGKFRADRLCDWKLTGDMAGKTCDRPICAGCTFQPAKDKDLCPPHRKMHDEWRNKKAAAV